MPRDPVCGLILDDRTAKFRFNHGGVKYFFCSVGCKKKFKRNRDKFVK
ncbi:YHS domain-containing protein [Candidatus Bathyarchaeota archaeon]|nr:YHS domain-containing protein [Candidatus Bathyarchaeota archaeon]